MGKSKKNFYDMYNDLSVQIKSHHFQAGEKLPSESEFMAQYHISRYTVRKVLEQLEKEQIIVKHQGKGCFVQEQFSPISLPKRSGQILLIASRAEHFYFMQCINGIEKALADSEYTLTIKFSNYNADIEAALLFEAFNNNYAGILLFPSDSGFIHTNQYLYRFIEEHHIPCISCGNILPFVHIPSVNTDDYLGGKLAARCFLQHGHSTFACIMNREEYSGCMRYAGFIGELRTSSELVKNDFVYWFGHLEKDSMFEEPACQALLKMAEQATAFFCFNDIAAVQLVNLLTAHGYRVPEDISVIGYDDSYLCETCPVSLTSLHQNPEQVGFVAAQNLLHLIEDPQYDCNKSFLPFLVERSSVKDITHSS